MKVITWKTLTFVLILCMLMLFALIGCAPVELNSVENQGDIVIFNYSDGHKLYERSNYMTVQYKQIYLEWTRIGNIKHNELLFNVPETGKVYKAQVSDELYDSTQAGEGLFVKYRYTTSGNDRVGPELIDFEIIPSEGKVPLPIDVD